MSNMVMFHVGDTVIHRTDGVCKVVATMEMEGAEPGIMCKYLHLSPRKDEGSCIYVPLERAQDLLRPAMSKESATRLLAHMGEVELLEIKNEKTREMEYKEILKSGDCLSLTGMIKALHERKEERKAKKKGLPSVDERYLKLAENLICSELSVPLNLSMQQTEERIRALVGA